jgi:hypothetical protein
MRHLNTSPNYYDLLDFIIYNQAVKELPSYMDRSVKLDEEAIIALNGKAPQLKKQSHPKPSAAKQLSTLAQLAMWHTASQR